MRKTRVAATVAALLMTSACLPESGFDVRVKRESLDLVFVAEDGTQELAPAPPTAPVIALGDRPLLPPPPTAVVPSSPPSRDCAVAFADDRPAESAKVYVTEPPETGTYVSHNKGTIGTVGPIAITFPYPRRSDFHIENVQTSTYENEVDGPVDGFSYETVSEGLDGSFTRTYYVGRYREGSFEGTVFGTAGQGRGAISDLQLVRQEVSSAGEVVSTFAPTPPITVFLFRSGTGTTWTSAGIDLDTNIAMTVEGEVLPNAAVDICGTMYDTYPVRSVERIVNLDTGYTYETRPDSPSVYYVSTNHGGLIIQREIHSTSTFNQDGVPTQVTQDYTSTLDSVEPEPEETP